MIYWPNLFHILSVCSRSICLHCPSHQLSLWCLKAPPLKIWMVWMSEKVIWTVSDWFQAVQTEKYGRSNFLFYSLLAGLINCPYMTFSNLGPPLLNYIYYLHNACNRNRQASGIFFISLIHFLKISDDFSTLPKFALPALHFSDFECRVMCYSQIEWNTTV